MVGTADELAGACDYQAALNRWHATLDALRDDEHMLPAPTLPARGGELRRRRGQPAAAVGQPGRRRRVRRAGLWGVAVHTLTIARHVDPRQPGASTCDGPILGLPAEARPGPTLPVATGADHGWPGVGAVSASLISRAGHPAWGGHPCCTPSCWGSCPCFLRPHTPDRIQTHTGKASSPRDETSSPSSEHAGTPRREQARRGCDLNAADRG